jgi:glycosyltransferase involved in cell wall biosynthesis
MKPVLMLLDNDLVRDNRVMRELDVISKANNIVLHLLCYGYSGKTYDFNAPNIIIHRIHLPKKILDALFIVDRLLPIWTLLWSFRIWRLLKNHNCEAVHAHDLYMIRPMYFLLKFGVKPRIVLDLHENYPATIQTYGWAKKGWRNFVFKPNRWEELERDYLSIPSYILVLSEYFRDQLLSRYNFLNQSQFIVYPNLPQIEKYQLEQKILSTKSPIIFCYLGVLAERRGLYDLMETFGLLFDERKPVRLKLAGPIDGPDKPAFQAFLNNFSENVDYDAWVDKKDMLSYLQSAHVLLSPLLVNDQHNSGIANKIFQYVLANRPLLVSNCIPQAKFVEHYKIGMVYQGDSKRSFFDAVTQMETDYEGFCYDNGLEILNDYASKYPEVSFLKAYE